MTKKEHIIQLIKAGKGNTEIKEKAKCRTIYISMIRKQFNLPPAKIPHNLNWKLAQQYYNDNHSLRETAQFFNVHIGVLLHAVNKDRFLIRTRSAASKLSHLKFKNSFRHSEKTKQNIREKRIQYMQQNPEQTAWSRRWKHEKSWPEKLFEDELNRRNITGWIYNLPTGIYEYDFGFPGLKLDIEIDGSWHNTEKQRQKDKLRDKYTLDRGWIVIRFSAKEIQKNVIDCVDKLSIIIKKMSAPLRSGSAAGFEPVSCLGSIPSGATT